MTIDPNLVTPDDIIRAMDDAAAPARREVLSGALAVAIAPFLAQQAQDSSTVADLRAQLAACQAQTADLQAALADCQGGGTAATVFGSSSAANTTGLVPPIPAYRSYLQPGETPTTVAADSGLRTGFSWVGDGGVVWFSIKEPAGPWLDALLDDMALTYPGVKVVATADHEPKDSWWDTGRIGQWQARQDAFEAVLANHPQVEGWTIVEGSSLTAAGAGDAYWSAVLRPNQGFGLDSYNPGIQTPKAYVDPAQVHGPRFDWIAAHGKVPAVAETGTGVVVGDADRSGQTAWTVANRDYLSGRAVRALVWDSGVNGPLKTGCRLTLAQMNAWLGR